MASILSLDVAGAFNNVSHERLIHNLRTRKIPAKLVNWVNSFLKDRQSFLTFDDRTSAMRQVNAGILQGSPVSPILFLFFNAKLVKGCEKLEIKASPVKFVNNVNILVYKRSTADTYKTLSKVHDVYAKWARTHGASFVLNKYELIHLSRTPRKFDIKINI